MARTVSSGPVLAALSEGLGRDRRVPSPGAHQPVEAEAHQPTETDIDRNEEHDIDDAGNEAGVSPGGLPHPESVVCM